MIIKNFGICGVNTEGVLKRELEAVEEFKPTLSILLAGTNDCGNKGELLPPQRSRAAIREMLSRLSRIGSEIIIMTAPPLIDRAFRASFGEEPFNGFMPNERLRIVNDIIREESHNFNTSLIDLYDIFSETDLESVYGYIRHRRNYNFVDDGCHPTLEGYRRIAFEIYSRIKILGLSTERIACIGDSITYGAYTAGEGKAETTGDNYPGVLKTLLEPNEEKAIEISEDLKKSVIYQISPRAFSTEGTLLAVEARLLEIAALGVDVVYLMPIAKADEDENEDFWSPRQKASKCNNAKNPYRISDFFMIDPEYGTENDLKSLVEKVHSLGMKIALDLVYYHAGPTFAKHHPNFVKHSFDGKTANGNWSFPELDFSKEELKEYLWKNMVSFVRDFGVDGFRCDVGDNVPLSFWEEGRRRIKSVNPDAFMICEGSYRSEDQLSAFDINYFWDSLSFDAILSRDLPAEDFTFAYLRRKAFHPKGARFLRLYENHDIVNDKYEKRFEEVYGPKAVEALLALCFTLDGIPFIYNGCEDCDTSRHSIFAKKGEFVIDRRKDACKRRALISKLAKLRHEERALFEGETTFIQTNHKWEIISFVRHCGKERILVTINLSTRALRVKHDTNESIYSTLISSMAERIQDEIELGAYGFMVEKI